MAVKIATYNIQYGKGQDGRYDLPRTIDAIRNQDIICPQEVTRNWLASNEDDQPWLLAEGLNMYTAYDGWMAAKQKGSERSTCMENDGSRSVLDQLFLTEDLIDCVNSARVDLEITASDHFPVFFEIEVR